MKRLYDNWIQLDGPNMTWVEKKLTSVFWQYANIKRHIRLEGSVIKGTKRWWHLRQLCKKANKSLLRMAKQRENVGLRPPPTPEELAEFKKDMGGDEVLNTHYMTPVKSKTHDLNMDIKYGN